MSPDGLGEHELVEEKPSLAFRSQLSQGVDHIFRCFLLDAGVEPGERPLRGVAWASVQECPLNVSQLTLSQTFSSSYTRCW
jgi:hypothetical protein